MERICCIAIKSSTKISYVSFGNYATVADIIEVLDEEVADLNGTSYQIVGVGFFSNSDSKALFKMISDWEEEIAKRLEAD